MRTTKILFLTFLSMMGMAFYACERDDNDTKNDSNTTEVTNYTLTVLPNNVFWGVATGSGIYAANARVDIEAAPASGYYFIRWSDGAVSNPRTITVNRDITLFALFSSNPNDVTPYNPEHGGDNSGGNNGGGNNGGDNGGNNGGNNNNGDNNGVDNGSNDDASSADWVDLGLPSGLLWATRNVGANSPEDYGYYFAWGETRTKSIYNWLTYSYCNGDYNKLTKYCAYSGYGNNGFSDNLTTLESNDDAATVVIGDGARTPTSVEWQELIDNCNSGWTSQNGVYGYIFIGKNGKSLFLPAAGYRWDNLLSDVGRYGCYWSSSLHTGYTETAWGCGFLTDGVFVAGGYARRAGFSVRAVRPAN